MDTRKTVILLTITCIIALMQGGCSSMKGPVKIVLPPDFEDKPQQAQVNENRFVDKQKPTTALESAVEISEKYAVLSAEAAELKQQNKSLQNEKMQFMQELATSKTQLDQTKQELTEANNLLLDTRIELNNWKSDVLGFRDEMRQADIAQLQTLEKILEVLGGEMTSQVAVAETQKSADSTSIEQK